MRPVAACSKRNRLDGWDLLVRRKGLEEQDSAPFKREVTHAVRPSRSSSDLYQLLHRDHHRSPDMQVANNLLKQRLV
jgi:hypothetical protein